jgi:hypothetical protein
MQTGWVGVAAACVLAGACGGLERLDADAGIDAAPSCSTGQSTIVGGGAAGVGAARVDADMLYWLSYTNAAPPNRDLLLQVPKQGGDATTLAAPCSVASCTPSFTLDETTVYYSGVDDNGPFVASIAKSGGVPLTLSKGSLVVSAIAVDATTLYLGSADEIDAMSKTGGALVPVVQEASVVLLGVDDFNVYWTTSDATRGGGVLNSTSMTNLASAVIATFDGLITAFAADTDHLYVASAPVALATYASAGTVSRVAKSTRQAIVVATGPEARFLSVNGSTLFIAGYGVTTTPTGGGPIASTPAIGDIVSFAVDDDAIYWGLNATVGGRLLRACR